MKPPLKWAGGKRWLVPYLHAIWERYRDRRLVEPLCGGLAITLGLRPTAALLNDINPHTINFYRWLKAGLQIELPMRYDAELYYRHRARFNWLATTGQHTSAEAASLFYYLNRTGYNGLCRFNRRGEFNVPFGRYNQVTYQTDFSSYRATFANWEFGQGNFESVVLRPDDLVYADPPYDVEFTQYTKDGFSWLDQVRLAHWLARHTGPTILSNQATSRIIELYENLGFTLRYLNAPRRISCTGDRRPAREVLAFRNIADGPDLPPRPLTPIARHATA